MKKTVFIVKLEDSEAELDDTYAFSNEKKCDEFENRLRKAYENFHIYSSTIIVDNPEDWQELQDREAEFEDDEK